MTDEEYFEAFGRLTDEITRLRAENERLTKERDSARDVIGECAKGKMNIVEKLLEKEREWNRATQQFEPTGKLMNRDGKEATAEIERLKAELAFEKHNHTEWLKIFDARTKERDEAARRAEAAELKVERLREALNFYVSRDADFEYLDKGIGTATGDGAKRLSARAALKETGPEGEANAP